MRRIDRYLLRVFVTSWVVSIVFFLGMFVVIHFFSRMSKIERATQAFEDAGMSSFAGFVHYYAMNFPFVLVQVMPFTLLMAGMWAVQHMARRNELVPVLTSGVSFRRLALPLILTAFLLGLGASAVRESVLPDLARERYRMERLIKGETPKLLDALPPLTDGYDRLFHIAVYDIQQRTARGVDLLDARDPGRHLEHIAELRYMEDGPAGEGWYRWHDGAAGPSVLATDLEPRDIEIESSALLFLSVDELSRLIERNPGRLNLQVLRHAHFSYALAPVILLLLGLPLVLRGTRHSPYVAAGLSLLISIVFFAVQSVLENMSARGEILDPLMGAWLPSLVFGTAGLLSLQATPT